MKKYILLLTLFTTVSFAQDLKLNPPDLTRGFNVMKALSLRASGQDFDTTDLKLQDISDLLWAANGINRPETGKRTAASAINAQDIDLYVIMKNAAYLYNPKTHSLELIADGDFRSHAAGTQKNFAKAPLFCLLVSDFSKFSRGTDSTKTIWAAEDAGIVSANISVFCASVNLQTRPRAYMDQQELRKALRLKDSQRIMLNHPVSYKN